jgi:hypothetical protein
MAILFEDYRTGQDTYSTISTGAAAVGQTFTPVASHTLTEVRIRVYLFGIRTGTLPIAIKATDGNGHPTGVDISTGSYADRSIITTDPNGEWIAVTMTDVTLTKDVKYALLPGGSGTGTNAIRWLRDASSPTYSRGDMVGGGAGSWATHTDKDHLFQERGDALTPVYPNNSRGRIGSLVHRYDREEDIYTLEMTFGGIRHTVPSNPLGGGAAYEPEPPYPVNETFGDRLVYMYRSAFGNITVTTNPISGSAARWYTLIWVGYLR